MCHLDILLLLENVNDVVVSFNFALEEAIECFSEFNMSCISKLEPKEAIFTLVLERIYWLCCQLALGKA